MTAADCISFLKESFELSPLQEQRMGALDALYREWNAQINVISRKDIDGLYSHHVLHSLAIARYLCTVPGLKESFAHAQVLDLGTGGGFPGIPLAILYPESRFTLCDSIGKKTRVARSVAESLGLGNVTVVNARAEALPERFDWVVSRAVAALPELLSWVKGKYGEGLLCLKGGDIVAETAEAQSRLHLPARSIQSWKLQSWLTPDLAGEDYMWFDHKFVLEVPPVR